MSAGAKAKAKPKPKAKTSGAKASAAGKGSAKSPAKSRRPAASKSTSAASRRRTAPGGRKGGGTKGAAGGRGLPGLSLRTLVMGSVAAALVVVGAAIGVTVDKALRDDPAPPPVETAAAPPAPKADPVPAPEPRKAPPAPQPATAEPPATQGPASVSPPEAPASTEALDYAHAAREYEEVPPSYPPARAETAPSRVPAPRVKPPVPEEHQLAALPTPPKQVLAPSPRRFSGDGPWLRNAVPVPALNGRPMIAVVIDDLGVDKRRSAKIVTLDGPLTTAWMTYADGVADQARAARAAGHELIIHMPMEPLNPDIDGGPGVLRTNMTADQVRAQVRAGLGKFEGYVGVNNHMGSKFTADAAGMAVVMDEMRANGLLFLDSKTSPGSVGAKLAAEAGVPHAERHVFIDNKDDVAYVLKQLAETERVARRTGYAIAIGHPHDGTFSALKQWLPTLEDKGLVLVPLSAIVRKRMGQG
ncbi:Putative periplasmic protein [Caenispirillum salinarum AK4]|uniref:Putative periplasmic protein n=1 Tax=Caenispirillum salinarum AK4 TaxID=1238182 RepID=K9HKB2_9PROT|nr:Putative periplasmic protein [Caenispirillum salinarum AK4]